LPYPFSLLAREASKFFDENGNAHRRTARRIAATTVPTNRDDNPWVRIVVGGGVVGSLEGFLFAIFHASIAKP
jgi:3-dehydroquinate synthetase